MISQPQNPMSTYVELKVVFFIRLTKVVRGKIRQTKTRKEKSNQ